MSAFLPSSDAHLHQASLTRRLKTQYSVEENKQASQSSQALVVSTVRDDEEEEKTISGGILAKRDEENTKPKQITGGILVKSSSSRFTEIPTPTACSVASFFSIAFDPTNDMFATGGADRVIKIWDLAKASVDASDALKITLTGHISPVRGFWHLAIDTCTSFQLMRINKSSVEIWKPIK